MHNERILDVDPLVWTLYQDDTACCMPQRKKLKQFLVRRLEMSSLLSEMAATCPKTVARINSSRNRVYACAAFAEIHCVSHLALRPIVRCGIHLGPIPSIIQMILLHSNETTKEILNFEACLLDSYQPFVFGSWDNGAFFATDGTNSTKNSPEWFDPLGRKTPVGRFTAGSPTNSSMKRKEHDLNQTCVIMFHVNLQGYTVYLQLHFYTTDFPFKTGPKANGFRPVKIPELMFETSRQA